MDTLVSNFMSTLSVPYKPRTSLFYHHINLKHKAARSIRIPHYNQTNNIRSINTFPSNRSSHKLRAIDPDIIVTSSNILPYAQFQVVSWILPMTIAGRLLNMDYENICKGLIVIAITKSLLYSLQIIHY